MIRETWRSAILCKLFTPDCSGTLTELAALIVSLAVIIAPPPACAQFQEGTIPVQVFEGENAGDNFGWLLDVVGDLNGDCVQEIVVSAPQLSGGKGKTYVYDLKVGALVRSHTGPIGATFGFVVDGAGDVDGDGVPDVIPPVDGLVIGSNFGHYWIESPGDVVGDGTPNIYAVDLGAANSPADTPMCSPG